jgi:hypothetical protein
MSPVLVSPVICHNGTIIFEDKLLRPYDSNTTSFPRNAAPAALPISKEILIAVTSTFPGLKSLE